MEPCISKKGYEMNLEITEEERDFFERMCVKALHCSQMGTPQLKFKNDADALRNLIDKLRALDSDLINLKEMDLVERYNKFESKRLNQ